MTKWYFGRGGKSFGPYNEPQFLMMAESGKIQSSDVVWREGWTEWRSACSVLSQPVPPPMPLDKEISFSQNFASANNPKNTDKGLQYGLTHWLATYGPIAAGISIVADFAQPILKLTAVFSICSLLIAIIAYASSRFFTTSKNLVRKTGNFFLILFACSTVWWGLQQVIPGARSNGALVGIVPGTEGLQKNLTNSLQRVESETKRVFDLLKQQADRDLREEEEMKRQMHEFKNQELEAKKQRLESYRAAINEAGYTVDINGLIKARMQGSNISGFEELSIKPDEKNILIALKNAQKDKEIYALLSWIQNEKDKYAFMRKISEILDKESDRFRKLFKGKSAKKNLCNVTKIDIPIGIKLLDEICKKNGAHFASAYSTYFLFYSYSKSEFSKLDTNTYSIEDYESLPIIDSIGLINTSKARECTYLRGEYRFIVWGGMQPYGAFETPGSRKITWFDVTDPDFEKFQFNLKCPYADVISGKKKMCKANVLMVSRCNGFGLQNLLSQPTLLKVLQ